MQHYTLEPLTKKHRTLEPLTRMHSTLEPLTKKEPLTKEPLSKEPLTMELLTMEPQIMEPQNMRLWTGVSRRPANLMPENRIFSVPGSFEDSIQFDPGLV